MNLRLHKLFSAIKTRQSVLLFLVFVLSCFLSGTILLMSGMLSRAELQTIDRMFEARRFLVWSPEAFDRLDISRLWAYHEKHEIPRRWWAWDYTLSWLLEPNHIPVKNKFVIFNHLLEDEPPPEAVETFPWMKPLMKFPYSRAEIANIVRFLAKSNAKLVILDNDFPQFSEDDAVLAKAISEASNGTLTGKKVPVLMASTVNRRSFINILQLDVTSNPSGVLKELSNLEPGVDVLKKYTGTTSMMLDEDLVVRRTVCSAADLKSKERSSITVKVLQALGQTIPPDLPREMDIDFAGPPNSDLYPVRPFQYLLDPALKSRLLQNADPQNEDVTLDDAIVIVGDGVTDVYATPFTNLGVNLMSGSEIIAQSIDTIARHSWRHRLSFSGSLVYLFLCSLLGAAFLSAWKYLMKSVKGLGKTLAVGLILDIACCVISINICYLTACFVFAYFGLIVPVIVPSISIMIASLSAALWERENERTLSLKRQLEHAEERLKLQEEKYEEELKRQLAELQVQEVLQDEYRRQEFIRRINHDLKAPVTVMSWILSRLKLGELPPEAVSEKIDKLAKTSNRLIDLLHELSSSYVVSSTEHEEGFVSERCQLNKILIDCVAMARPLAEMKNDKIELLLPERVLWMNAVPLRLSRIFDNLIRNAILHNPNAIHITIEARSSAHVHQIFVSDNGKGIDQDKLPLLFDKSRMQELKSSNGDGLGLQIVSAFVESFGGKIAVSSKVGRGTTFTITLPSSHLEAGGDSGEDILSTGQHTIIVEEKSSSLSMSSKATVGAIVQEARGSEND